MDRAQEAWEELDREVDPQQQEYGRILTLFSLERGKEAQQRLDLFIEENQSWAAFLVATVYASNGDADSAFAWLDRAYQQRDGWMTGILNDPLFKNLHDDPRWAEQLDRLNLPH